MKKSEHYQGMHAEAGRAVDSHGNTNDWAIFVEVHLLRNELRTKIAGLLSGLTQEGHAIMTEYLDGEHDAAHELQWWLDGCQNHQDGSDA